MTQGFKDYLVAAYGSKNGTVNSYVRAIAIIDDMLTHDDVFALNGHSIASIEDTELLHNICEFVLAQQMLFKNGNDSIFRNIKPDQESYPKKGFCSAAIKQLFSYHTHVFYDEKANAIVEQNSKGRELSKKLISLYKVDRDGRESISTIRTRIGQDYFRGMVLANYDNKCCITGLNVPQTLRASHIVAWAVDKVNRMNPENGLCLSATYDAAFDKHLISLDDDYRLIISREIKDYYTNNVTKEYFENFEGKQIIFPIRYLPSKSLLAKHRNLLKG